MTCSRGGICTDPPAGHGQRPANTWRGAKSSGKESDCVCVRRKGGEGEEALTLEVGSEYHLVSKELPFLGFVFCHPIIVVCCMHSLYVHICTRTRKSEDLPQPFGPVTRRCLKGPRERRGEGRRGERGVGDGGGGRLANADTPLKMWSCVLCLR